MRSLCARSCFFSPALDILLASTALKQPWGTREWGSVRLLGCQMQAQVATTTEFSGFAALLAV